MAFREVGVYEVREVLRLWLAGEGFRAIERLVGMDRKTVRRYVGVAEGLGLGRDGGEEQLTDVFMAMVVEAVRPHRTDGHGSAWRLLMASHDLIATWVEADLTAVTLSDDLAVWVSGRGLTRAVTGLVPWDRTVGRDRGPDVHRPVGRT
jgi:hypothetical protein